MGVDGAAIATVASQLLSGILCTWWFFARVEDIHFTCENLKFSAPHCKRLATSGCRWGLNIRFLPSARSLCKTQST